MRRRFLMVAVAASLMGSIQGERAMANDSPAVAAAKEAQAIAEAEKAAAEARLSKAKADKSLAQIDALSKAELDKAVADAQAAVYTKQQAAATAQAAIIAAEQANDKAKFGLVSANTVAAGGVTAAAGAGTLEANLLSARALNEIGVKISKDIGTVPNDKGYVIFTGTQKPDFSDLKAFEFKRAIIQQMFDTAEGESQKADLAFSKLKMSAAPDKSSGATEAVGAAITGAGALLDSFAKIGSFFQSSYDVAKLDITGSDNDLLATSVAKGLTSKDVYIPNRWSPPVQDDLVTKLFGKLAGTRSKSAGKLVNDQAQAKLLQDRLVAEKTDAGKLPIQNVLSAYERSIAAHQLAQKTFDDFLTSLATADAAGAPLVAKIADEKFASDKLADGAASLLLNVHNATGGSYTKKNIWTFFGGMPFFVAGGSVASYILVDKDGKILKSGQYQQHGGYYKVNRVAKVLK